MSTLQMRKLRLREFKYFLRGHPTRMKGGELVQISIPKGFPGGSAGKNQPVMQEKWVQYLGQEDSPGGGSGNPLQYTCLENPMNRGAWGAIVHGVTERRT